MADDTKYDIGEPIDIRSIAKIPKLMIDYMKGTMEIVIIDNPKYQPTLPFSCNENKQDNDR